MPAQRRYPTPQAQLLQLALEARHLGLSFNEFWDLAVRPGRPPVTWRMPPRERLYLAVVWPADTDERNLARDAIQATRGGWRRAYEGAPALRRERALTALFGVLDDPGLELPPRVAA